MLHFLHCVINKTFGNGSSVALGDTIRVTVLWTQHLLEKSRFFKMRKLVSTDFSFLTSILGFPVLHSLQFKGFSHFGDRSENDSSNRHKNGEKPPKVLLIILQISPQNIYAVNDGLFFNQVF